MGTSSDQLARCYCYPRACHRFFAVRPFDSEPEPGAEDVANVWINSVRRLGLQAVYPPQEDFHVADLWAVVVGDTAKPLLSRAVRIGRLEPEAIHKEILTEQSGRIHFAETSIPELGYANPVWDRFEVMDEIEDGRVALDIVAFPTITLSYLVNTRGRGGIVGGNRNSRIVEEITISPAWTYGIESNIATALLEKYCDQLYKYKCTSIYIKNVIISTLGPDALTPQAGHSVGVDLQLVSRVFLTRKIVQKRDLVDSRGISAGYDREHPPPDAGTENRSLPDGEGAFSTEHRINVGFDQMTFRYPIVFGYRAVSFNRLRIEAAKAR